MNIKIFMCCHNGFDHVPPLCIPIQCGSEINAPVSGAVPDNIGDNISAKNREYCELTAHYYAWKNVNADYYGFCHYRRFFCFEENLRRPYLVRKKLSSKDIYLLGSEKMIEDMTCRYDIIIPRSENMGVSAREHYVTSKYHYAEDLELFICLLKDKYPHISEAADQYMKQDKQYFCNMFIMKKELFFEYCETLFDVLSEFDKGKRLRGDFQSNRVDGYLGEIFTGIFVSAKSAAGAHTKEVRRLDVGCSLKKRIAYALLPPESKGRFCTKKMLKRINERKLNYAKR